jgi:hypothetical protein
MISLQKSGLYKLIETKHHTKILYLDNDTYAWVEPPDIGEILVASYAMHKTDCVLGIGRYRLYDVDDELYLSDHPHLELEVGGDHWQGYVLLTGLPDRQKRRSRIIPTPETITGNFAFERREAMQTNSSKRRVV